MFIANAFSLQMLQKFPTNIHIEEIAAADMLKNKKMRRNENVN